MPRPHCKNITTNTWTMLVVHQLCATVSFLRCSQKSYKADPLVVSSADEKCSYTEAKYNPPNQPQGYILRDQVSMLTPSVM